jgi:enoyl-CoA hydratase/carnithine racemase
MKKYHEDENIKVMVIVSKLQGIFCAGADIKWFHRESFDY